MSWHIKAHDFMAYVLHNCFLLATSIHRALHGSLIKANLNKSGPLEKYHMEKYHQAKIIEAMMHPGFYPHPVESIEQQETHISMVFLTGSFVYKIKKPVDLGFLDFTSLKKRQHYCRQEVDLNRRLSHGVYIDAVPITCHDSKYALNGSGTTVEFAVKMHQLAETDSMRDRLKHAKLNDGDIEALVRLLAHSYMHSPIDPETEPSCGFAWKKNLQELEPFIGVWINRQQFEFVRSATRSFYREHKTIFHRRRNHGKIRDCHGDLRTDHIYFTKNGIQIIDCIEFNDRLRYLDVINDLAFLAMDLEFSHFPEIARKLIRLYIEQTDDVDALPLLSFYRCYRAMVRCKISCFRLREIGSRNTDYDTLRAAAERYLSMARGYAAAFSRPILWVVCGLPASGKSTIAKALSAVFDISVIRSDVIRKGLFAGSPGPSAESAYGGGIYSTYASEVTYDRMFALAQDDLQKRKSVVIDATFSRTSQRARALRIAEHRQTTPVFVECRAAEPILASRLLKRESEPSVSDARLVHLEAFKQRFEPMAQIANEVHIIVNTENSLAVCLRQILLTGSLWDDITQNGGKNV